MDDHDDNNFTTIEYGRLPLPAQKEAVEYLTSDEFIIHETEEYVLNNIRHMSQDVTYPSYSVTITDVKVQYTIRDKLFIQIYGKLVKIPTQVTIDEQVEEGVRINRKIRCVQGTLQDLAMWIKEGFSKASNDSPLVTSYGNYLGSDIGRYMIYLKYDNINVHLL